MNIHNINEQSEENHHDSQPCYLLYPSHHAAQHPNRTLAQLEPITHEANKASNWENFSHYLKLCFWFFIGALSLLAAFGLASLGITCLLVSLPLAVTAVIGFVASVFTLVLALFAGVAAYLICKSGAEALQKAQKE